MRKILLSVILLGFIVSKSQAQANVGPQLSIGPEIGMPLGQANKVYNLVEGGSIKLELPVVQNLNITLSFGFDAFKTYSYYTSQIPEGGVYTFAPQTQYIAHVQYSKYIPVELGLKNYIKNTPLYVEIDLGASIDDNGDYGNSQAAFIYAPIIGVALPSGKNSFDFGARYEGRVVTGGTISQLALRVAYKFGLK